jgi:hypothetical protein
MESFTKTGKAFHHLPDFLMAQVGFLLQVDEVLRIEQLKTNVLNLPDIYLERQMIQQGYDSFQFLENKDVFYAFEQEQGKSLDFLSDYHFQGGGIN